jgi:hypothetical protein
MRAPFLRSVIAHDQFAARWMAQIRVGIPAGPLRRAGRGSGCEESRPASIHAHPTGFHPPHDLAQASAFFINSTDRLVESVLIAPLPLKVDRRRAAAHRICHHSRALKPVPEPRPCP